MDKKLFFSTPRGTKLCGILSDTKPPGEHPIVIMFHGLTMNKDILLFKKMCAALAEKGIACFRVDFFGHGESAGCFDDLTLSKAVENVHAAIRFIKEKGYRKVGLVGSSFGGNACLLAAEKHPSLFCLALRCPVAHYAESDPPLPVWPTLTEWKKNGHAVYAGWMGKKTKIPFSFAADFKNHDGYAAAQNITVPTLIVHGDADTTVPLKQSTRLATLLRNGKLEIISGADHLFSDPEHFKKMFQLLLGFIASCAHTRPCNS